MTSGINMAALYQLSHRAPSHLGGLPIWLISLILNNKSLFNFVAVTFREIRSTYWTVVCGNPTVNTGCTVHGRIEKPFELQEKEQEKAHGYNLIPLLFILQ